MSEPVSDPANAAGFDAGWLKLRAPFDAAVAGRGPAALLANRFGAALRRQRERGPLSLVDLGGGTGANVCRLAPRIPGSQDWTVVDSDPALLADVGATIAAWGRQIGARVAMTDDGATVTTPQRIVSVRTHVADLRNGLAGLSLAGALPGTLAAAHGVTGSALLDLVSADWVAATVAALAVHRIPALFTLNVDGDLQWRPDALVSAPGDAAIAAAFRRDLVRDKGFGPALGHRAAAVAAAAFAAQGYTAETARADWRIGGADGAMHRAMLSFIVSAALAQPPEADPIAERGAGSVAESTDEWRQQVESWAVAKAGQVDAGGLDLTVGHVDLLALM